MGRGWGLPSTRLAQLPIHFSHLFFLHARYPHQEPQPTVRLPLPSPRASGCASVHSPEFVLFPEGWTLATEPPATWTPPPAGLSESPNRSCCRFWRRPGSASLPTARTCDPGCKSAAGPGWDPIASGGCAGLGCCRSDVSPDSAARRRGLRAGFDPPECRSGPILRTRPPTSGIITVDSSMPYCCSTCRTCAEAHAAGGGAGADSRLRSRRTFEGDGTAHLASSLAHQATPHAWLRL